MTTDRCRPYGITRPTELPPDDALTDLQAHVRGRLDGLAELIAQHPAPAPG